MMSAAASEYEFGKRKAGEPAGDAQGEDRARERTDCSVSSVVVSSKFGIALFLCIEALELRIHLRIQLPCSR